MAPVTIDAGARNSYYSAGNVGWSARSLFAYRTAIQNLAAATTATWGNAATSSAIAQSFTTVGAIDVNEIRIALNKVLSPTDNISLNIYSDTGANLPNASIQAADNLYNGANISSTASWLAYQFATPVALSASTKYWIVVERSGAVDASNHYQARADSGSVYAGGGRSLLVSGVWGAESATVDLPFQILTETPSALYAVTQSTEPALHVWKSTDDGANWTEQDAADNPTVTNATHPFDACDTRSGPYIGTAFFTAANTVRARLFDMSTDQWGTDLGAADASTDASNERSIRIAIDNTFTTAAPGSQHLWFSSSTDDADLVGARRTTSTWAAVTSTNFLSAASTEASLVSDVVVDKAPIGFQQRIYYAVGDDTFRIRSAISTTYGTATSMASAADVETEHASSTFQIYQVSGVDRIIAAYIDTDGTLDVRTASLEVTSASVTLGTDIQISAATTTAGRQLSTCAFDGDGYVAVSVSGTGITYFIDAGLAESWDGGTSHVSGLTASSVSQLLSIPGYGLALVYTDNGDAKFDWIVAPTGGNVNVNGSHATATALANAATLKVTITGANATATSLANASNPKVSLTGSVSTATALANVGTQTNDNTVTGSTATASSLANVGTTKVTITGSTATGSALANNGTTANDNTVTGSHATGTGLANIGTTKVTITGSSATASALANVGTQANDNTVTGSNATATALANVGYPKVTVTGSSATASALANDGIPDEGGDDVNVGGSHATGTALANAATTRVRVQTAAHAAAFAGPGLVASQIVRTGSAGFATVGTPRMAQSVSFGSTTTISSVSFFVGKSGAPADTLVVELQTDSAGVPSGVVLATSAQVSAADLATTDAWTGFQFPSNVSLSASTTYWLVLGRTGALSDTDFYTFTYDGNLYAGGTIAEFGASWSTDPNTDLAFVLFGSFAGTTKVTVTGSTATASALANVGTTANDNTITGSNATASALANVGYPSVRVNGATATSSALANDGTTANDTTVEGATATGTALANVGYPSVRVNGTTATSSALANDGTVTVPAVVDIEVDGAHATGTALANDGIPKVTITGSVAIGSGLANVGYPSVRAYGVQAYSAAEAYTGTLESNVSIAGSNATATGQANVGSIFVTITGSTSTASALANVGTQTNDYALAGAHATAYAQAWDGIVTVPATIAVYPADADHYQPTEHGVERYRYVIPRPRYMKPRIRYEETEEY
jgi:hypothetical protein